MKPKRKAVKGWEELFDKGFVFEEACSHHSAMFVVYEDSDTWGKGIEKNMRQLARPEYFKAFIRQVLLSSHEKVIKEIEGMKIEFNPEDTRFHDPFEVDGYNQALSDLIAHLKSKSK